MPGARPTRGYIALIAVVGVVIVLLIVGLLNKGGGSSPTSTSGAPPQAHVKHTGAHARPTRRPSHPTTAQSTRVALSLRPSAAVYVCLIDNDNGRKVIPGLELQPGASTATYHAKHFTITRWVTAR